MPEQALYLKWRPRQFDDVIGQAHITRALRNALAQNRIRHAYLFNGPRGTGKTTMARILAKAVNCTHPDPAERPCNECRNCVSINENRSLDLIEIDAASNNGVEDVRKLRETVNFSPSEGRYKVYIVDEVHRFSGAAFDALLKTLEEPPPHVMFILATTELDKVPPTIRSRSLTFEFRRVSLRDVTDRLALIAEHEGANVERGALELVAQQGTGSVRDSISLLDQLISAPEERITVAMAERMLGTAGSRAVGKVVAAIIAGKAADGLDAITEAVEDGADPTQFGRQIVEYLRQLLLVQTGGPSMADTSEDRRAMLEKQATQIGRGALLQAIRAFNGALNEIRSGWQPTLPLELALVESIRPVAEPAPAPAPRREAPKAASSPAAEPDPAPTGGLAAPTLKLTDIQAAWPNVIAEAKRILPTIGAMLAYVTPIDFSRGTLTLSVSPQQNWVENRLKEPNQAGALARALQQAFGVALKYKIVVGATGGTVDATITDDPYIKDQASKFRVQTIDESEED